MPATSQSVGEKKKLSNLIHGLVGCVLHSSLISNRLLIWLFFFSSSGQLPHKHKLVIAGNHELSFDQTFTHPFQNLSSGADKDRRLHTG